MTIVNGGFQEPRLVLRVNDLQFQRDGFEILVPNWELPAGSILGLVGANGAGKTTFLSLLAGRLLPTRGDIQCCELGINEFGYRLPEVVALAETDGSGAILDQSLARHMALMSAAYARWDSTYAERLAELLGVSMTQRWSKLSRGNRAKALVVLAESSRPRVLLLDEPTSSLDPPSRIALLGVLKQAVAEDTTRAIVVSSHLLDDLSEACTITSFVRRGRVHPPIALTRLEGWGEAGAASRDELIAQAFGEPTFL